MHIGPQHNSYSVAVPASYTSSAWSGVSRVSGWRGIGRKEGVGVVSDRPIRGVMGDGDWTGIALTLATHPTHTHACMHACMHTHAHTHTHTYPGRTHTHTHIHTHTHTHTRTHLLPSLVPFKMCGCHDWCGPRERGDNCSPHCTFRPPQPPPPSCPPCPLSVPPFPPCPLPMPSFCPPLSVFNSNPLAFYTPQKIMKVN